MAITAQALINIALTNLGILDAGGTPNVSDSNEGLIRLNQMIQQWHIQDKFVWSVGQASYGLTASQGAYPIGPAAAAPFNVPRPTYIQQALIGLAGPNAAKQINYPMRLIGQQEYGELADSNSLSHIPQLLYNDRASPSSTLYLWPVPRVAAATNLILYTWAQLGSFATLATAVDLPDGYQEAITNALAVRLMPMFGVAINAQVGQLTSQLAQQAEAALVELNTRARGLMVEPPPRPTADPAKKGTPQT